MNFFKKREFVTREQFNEAAKIINQNQLDQHRRINELAIAIAELSRPSYWFIFSLLMTGAFICLACYFERKAG